MAVDDSASDDEVMITRLLEKSIRRTEAVDREALCILAGEKVSQPYSSRLMIGLAITFNDTFLERRGKPFGLRIISCHVCS